MSYLLTYELHISLIVTGLEREGTMLLCFIPKIPDERREKAYNINALVKIYKYHKCET